jgi:hypothetical protein
MISALEIFRRFLWNFIRVEKEHVVNVGDFRVVPQFEFPYESVLSMTKMRNLAINGSEIDNTVITTISPMNITDERTKLSENKNENRYSVPFKSNLNLN